MKFKILTLFPDMIKNVLSESILGRAIQSGAIEAEVIDIRTFSQNKHKNTDDTPYGGGAGMVMLAQPIYDAMQYAMGENFSGKRLYLSPRGETFTQKKAEALANEEEIILLCGHYEGIDQRIIDLVIDEEISVGDYVLTGGELGALIIVDAVSRLVKGVLGSDESSVDESFSSGLLEYPQYTRPREFMGLSVPDVLLSGHQANIDRWRRDEALKVTFARRPEMLRKIPLDKHDHMVLRRLRDERKKNEMIRIGFIDYYLDEWHANNYPEWIKDESEMMNVPFTVAYAWEDKAKEGGMNGKEWCEKNGVELLSSREEVVEKSDVLVVLSPDNSEEHERLAEEALKSGKPVYVDKTFAPDLAAAKRMFALAEKHNTPLCSSSALRCARSLDRLKGDTGIVNFSVTGGGNFEIYAVHQLEMIVSVMGTGAKRVMVTGGKFAHNVTIDFGKGRYATMSQANLYDFTCAVTYEDGSGEMIVPKDYFKSFIHDMLVFFKGGTPVAPKEETLSVIALIQALREADRKKGAWIRVEE